MSLFFKILKTKTVFLSATLLVVVFCGQAFAGEVQRVNKFVFDTIPLNLEEITESAGTIFSGIPIKIEKFDKDPISGLPVVKYTFKITEGIKGVKNKKTISFKQWATVARESNYIEGQKYLLFLYPDSKKGLTSPVGYLQGHFEVKKEIGSENEVVKNKVGNAGLLRNLATQKRVILNDQNLHDYLDASSEQGDFVRYKDFVKAVKYLVEKKQ